MLTFLSVSIRALPTESGTGPFPVVMCFLDVTDRHAAAALLRYEARHDHMTGLANRHLVLETHQPIPARAGNVGGRPVHRPRPVQNGRTIPSATTPETPCYAPSPAGWRKTPHPQHTVGRLAGDEFVVVVPDATELELQEAAGALLTGLSKPVRIAGRDVVVTCSIGIVVTERGAGLGIDGTKRVSATDILRNADVAMYYAKQHGRNRLATFDERFRRRAVDRLELEEQLRNGLEHGQIWPAYQPIIALDRSCTASVEALARWTHPERGNVPPTVPSLSRKRPA